MHPQPTDRGSALNLRDHCVYLARDGALLGYAKTPEFFMACGASSELADGRTLALFHAGGPQDVHYPIWEMHPDGDELLVALSGSLSVELRDAGDTAPTPLPAQAAFIVPAGVWHRLIVHEPMLLIAITPRHGTRHEAPPAR